MFERMREDIQSVFHRDPAARNAFEVVTCYPGLHAVWLHRVAHGIDDRPVVTESEPKSISRESTFQRDLHARLDRAELSTIFTELCLRLAQARSRSVQLALEAGCSFAAEPAGLFGWVETGVDTDVLAQRMLDEGYLLAPGALFHASRQPCTLMRINFTTTQDAAFWRVLQRVVAQSR